MPKNFPGIGPKYLHPLWHNDNENNIYISANYLHGCEWEPVPPYLDLVLLSFKVGVLPTFREVGSIK